MKINSIKLENFRGIKKLDINLDGKDTDIYGANGTGKTTIANAICWLLLDCPATDEKDFDPKTTGAHDLHHSVEISFECDGTTVTLSKDFYELWTRKRGSASKSFSGNTTDFFINGVPNKKKDFQEAVERICGVDAEKIKMLMLHDYFIEGISTDNRRKILFEICGDVSDEDVIKKNGLEKLIDVLQIPGSKGQKYSIDEYKKIATAQRRKLNKDLEIIPERIDEATKMLPNVSADEAALKEELKAAEDKKEELSMLEHEELAAREDGSQAKEINRLKIELQEKKSAYMEAGNKMNESAFKEIEKLTNEKLDVMKSISLLEEKIKDSNGKIERAKTQRELLLNDYKKADAETWDEGNEICPTCGQTLPAEKVKELRDEFNVRKSNKKMGINSRGQSCSKDVIKGLEEEIKGHTDELTANKSRLKDITDGIEERNKAIKHMPDFETTEEYQEINSKIEKERTNQCTQEEWAVKIKERFANSKEIINGKIQEFQKQLSQIDTGKKISARIEQLGVEKSETAAALENVEYGIHLCEEFTRCKADMVTLNINSRFKNVRFNLFENQVNGGLKEICEPTIENNDGKWVRYKSANTAARANAELEIIDVLNDFYQTNLPVIMDRAESVVHPAEINEQLIRLIVSADDKELRIDVKGE
jgi:DNA repair exonuclease SbcCD ATPase subunit